MKWLLINILLTGERWITVIYIIFILLVDHLIHALLIIKIVFYICINYNVLNIYLLKILDLISLMKKCINSNSLQIIQKLWKITINGPSPYVKF